MDVFWDNLYIRPETYNVKGKRIIFDTKEESGLLKGGRITVTYYDKQAIENIIEKL